MREINIETRKSIAAAVLVNGTIFETCAPGAAVLLCADVRRALAARQIPGSVSWCVGSAITNWQVHPLSPLMQYERLLTPQK